MRLLSRSPAFTLVAVLSPALGIGASTAIFMLLDQLMLRLLPVKNPQQLVMIWATEPHLGDSQRSQSLSYPMYQDFQRQAQAFSHVFCRFETPLAVSIGNQTDLVKGELVSGNFFQALGVGPAVGRVFSPEEDDRIYKGIRSSSQPPILGDPLRGGRQRGREEDPGQQLPHGLDEWITAWIGGGFSRRGKEGRNPWGTLSPRPPWDLPHSCYPRLFQNP